MMEETTQQASAPAPATTTIGNASAALAVADAASAATPPATPETSPAAATAQPETTDGSSVTTDAKGEPPKWRWQDILANARETSAKEAEARLRQEYESRLKPYEGVDEQTLAGYRTLRAAEQGDARARAAIAQANPQLAQALGWTQTPQADPEPEPDFVLPVKDANGNIVGERPIYSADQQAKREAWLKRQMLADFRKEIAPLQQTAATFQQQQATASFTTTVGTVLAKMKAADPAFATHTKDVWDTLNGDARLLAMATGDDQRPPDPEMALEIAWSRVHRAKVLPTQQQQSEAKVLTDIQQRAVAAHASAASTHTATPTNTLGDARAALAYAAKALGQS